MNKKFGDEGDFWAKYKKAAIESDKDLTTGLNNNLDNILITVSARIDEY